MNQGTNESTNEEIEPFSYEIVRMMMWLTCDMNMMTRMTRQPLDIRP